MKAKDKVRRRRANGAPCRSERGEGVPASERRWKSGGAKPRSNKTAATLATSKVDERWAAIGDDQPLDSRLPRPIERSRIVDRKMMSDEDLVARSMGGDLDSFNQLVLRWERPIYALAITCHRPRGRRA